MSEIDQILGTMAPISTACAALLFVLIWQTSGMILLAPLLRNSGLSRLWSLVFAWFLWLPLSGTGALILSLLRLADQSLLRGVMAAVVTCALVMGVRGRSWLRDIPRLNRGSRPAMVMTGLIFLLQITQLIFAAHPQRLYDQLSYHLAIPKLVLMHGHPYYKFYDPHLVIGGTLEYAFLWPRAFINSDFFSLGVGQCWIYLASVLPIVASTYLALRDVDSKYAKWSTLTIMAAVPGLVPDSELFSIAKPGALLFAGTYLILITCVAMPKRLLTVTVALGMILLACNPTFVHVAIALFVVLVLNLYWRRAEWSLPPALITVAAVCLATALIRSWVLTGTLLFPSDARFLSTPYSDKLTLDYWHWVAFRSNQSFIARWSGAPVVFLRSPGLAVWAGLGLASLAVWGRRQAALHWQSLLWFLAIYALAWPFFYDNMVFSRFVAGFVAALVLTAVVGALAAPKRFRYVIIASGIIGGMVCSSIDVIGRKLYMWNQSGLLSAYTPQFPRMVTAYEVNGWTKSDDTVVTETSEKYFFTAAVLSSTLSPPERKIWDELIVSPQKAAREHRVKAVVMEIQKPGSELPEFPAPYNVPIRTTFKALEPFGEVTQIARDLVLRSDCYFQAKPCPASH